MTKAFLSTFLFVISVFALSAQQKTPAILQVSTQYTNGTPVPNQEVLVRPGRSFSPDEFLIRTDANGYWSDTVDLPESINNPGDYEVAVITLDSGSTGIFPRTNNFASPIFPAYSLLDTLPLILDFPLQGVDNCSNLAIWTDSVPSDSMFVIFRNNLNRLNTGITWVYGDGDTGHAHQSFHRYTVPGTYYYCFYSDSCGPVCDSVTVPTKATGSIGLEENKSILSINVYPNPTTGILSLESITGANIEAVKIFDLSGALVYQRDQVLATRLSLTLNHLAKGIYFLKIDAAGDVELIRIVKE